MTDVAGRTAFITGGANGIGLGIARAFAGAGRQAGAGRSRRRGAGAAPRRSCRATTEVETLVLDVRDREAYARIADEAEAALGPVSLLCQQRRRRRRRARPQADLRAVGLGHRRQPRRRDQRRPDLPAAHGRARPRRPDRQHRLRRRPGRGGQRRALPHRQVRRGRHDRGAARRTGGARASACTVLCPGPVATDIIARTRQLQPRRGATAGQRRARAARAHRADDRTGSRAACRRTRSARWCWTRSWPTASTSTPTA